MHTKIAKSFAPVTLWIKVWVTRRENVDMYSNTADFLVGASFSHIISQRHAQSINRKNPPQVIDKEIQKKSYSQKPFLYINNNINFFILYS